MSKVQYVKTGSMSGVSPIGRLSFPALFTPKAPNKDKPNHLKYQATILLEKGDDEVESFKTQFLEGAKAAAQAKWGKKVKGVKYGSLLHDGDEKDFDGYEGMWALKASANEDYPCEVLDARKKAITDQKSVYAGCDARIVFSYYCWEHPTGGKGVSANLTTVQKARDNDPFTGGGGSGSGMLDDLPDDVLEELEEDESMLD